MRIGLFALTGEDLGPFLADFVEDLLHLFDLLLGRFLDRDFAGGALDAKVERVAVLSGDPIKAFISVLFVGLLSGTYSSIFTATPLLVTWEEKVNPSHAG